MQIDVRVVVAFEEQLKPLITRLISALTSALQDQSAQPATDGNATLLKAKREKPIKTPVAEAPVAEAPVAEAPVAEAPVAEAPVAEAPVAEAPTPADVLNAVSAAVAARGRDFVVEVLAGLGAKRMTDLTPTQQLTALALLKAGPQ
jgi:hypothetical protein